MVASYIFLLTFFISLSLVQFILSFYLSYVYSLSAVPPPAWMMSNHHKSISFCFKVLSLSSSLFICLIDTHPHTNTRAHTRIHPQQKKGTLFHSQTQPFLRLSLAFDVAFKQIRLNHFFNVNGLLISASIEIFRHLSSSSSAKKNFFCRPSFLSDIHQNNQESKVLIK